MPNTFTRIVWKNGVCSIFFSAATRALSGALAKLAPSAAMPSLNELASGCVLRGVDIDALDDDGVRRVFELVVRRDGARHRHECCAFRAGEGFEIGGPRARWRDERQRAARGQHPGDDTGRRLEEFATIDRNAVFHVLPPPVSAV